MIFIAYRGGISRYGNSPTKSLSLSFIAYRGGNGGGILIREFPHRVFWGNSGGVGETLIPPNSPTFPPPGIARHCAPNQWNSEH